MESKPRMLCGCFRSDDSSEPKLKSGRDNWHSCLSNCCGNNAGATDITVTQSQAVSGNYGQVVIGGNLGTKEVTIRTPNSIGYSSDSRQYQGSDPSKIDYSYDPHLRTPFSTGYYVNGRRGGENEFFNYWSNSAGGSSVKLIFSQLSPRALV